MKVLVLSCSTGGGHNAAAKAVYEALCGRGIQAEFMDAFQLTGENTAKRVGNFYVRTVQHAPAAFGAAYRLATVISSPRRKSPVYFANKLVSGKLEDYIRDHRIDVAVVSHLYPAETLTDLKTKGKQTFRSSLSARIIPASRSGRRRSATRIFCRIRI